MNHENKTRFPLPLVLIAGELEGTRQWTLEKPFVYVSSYGTITVPAGFITDLASIPRAFHNICGPADDLLFASIPHDYLYRTGVKSKEVADLVFKEALFNLGVGWVKREAAYLAVKWFGGRWFNSK